MPNISRRTVCSVASLCVASLLSKTARGSSLIDMLPSSESALPPGYTLAWRDEFDGNVLDRSKWDFRTDTKLLSTQLPENISVRDGSLVIALKAAAPGKAAKYMGGGVISKAALGFGYYECRMRVRTGKGWHSSFWLMKYDGSGGTGTSAAALELDVIENDSIDLNSYEVTTHRWKGGHDSFGHKKVSTPSLSDFHVYGCEYTAASVRYFFDGAVVDTVDISAQPKGPVNVWLTSIAAGFHHTESVDNSRLPGHAEFDYVRYYRRTE